MYPYTFIILQMYWLQDKTPNQYNIPCKYFLNRVLHIQCMCMKLNKVDKAKFTELFLGVDLNTHTVHK